ncbi:MAG: universal stress protein [Chloroflexota bacterium]
MLTIDKLFKKILVPLDGSKLAENALGAALVLAQAGNAELILLSVPVMKHVMVMPEYSGYATLLPEQSLEESRRDFIEYLAHVRENRLPADLPVRLETVEGDEASVIVDRALAEQVDLIVMATHGRSGFSRWMMGSVTEKVLQQAHCPVLAVRSAEPIERMLITLDGSPVAEAALEPGLALAEALGADVTLLQVQRAIDYVNPAEVARLDAVESGLGMRLQDSVYYAAESYLNYLAKRYGSLLTQSLQTAVLDGGPARRITEYIEDNEIDLVVMATHGRTGLKRWLYGSVTEKVLRTAPCAKFIMRPPPYLLS